MFGVNFREAGFTATWISQHTSAPDTAEVAGSSPVVPAIQNKEFSLNGYLK
jgi:hypothetical protein